MNKNQSEKVGLHGCCTRIGHPTWAKEVDIKPYSWNDTMHLLLKLSILLHCCPTVRYIIS